METGVTSRVINEKSVKKLRLSSSSQSKCRLFQRDPSEVPEDEVAI